MAETDICVLFITARSITFISHLSRLSKYDGRLAEAQMWRVRREECNMKIRRLDRDSYGSGALRIPSMGLLMVLEFCRGYGRFLSLANVSHISSTKKGHGTSQSGRACVSGATSRVLADFLRALSKEQFCLQSIWIWWWRSRFSSSSMLNLERTNSSKQTRF